MPASTENEPTENEPIANRRKRELAVLVVASVACVALPLVARNALNNRVSVELAAQASEALGLPIELGTASVGLTGTLEIRDVRVGEFFRAKRVMASIAPSAQAANGLAPNELLIDQPQLELELLASGGTNLDAMLARRAASSKSNSKSASSTGSASRLRTIRFVNGGLRVNVENIGTIVSSGINLWMRDGKVHALFGATDIDVHKDDVRLRGTLPRAALDYRRGHGLHRLLADGGTLSIKGPRGRGMLKELMISAGLGGEDYQLSAQTGIDRATGTIKISAQRAPGGFALESAIDSAPLALIAPWLPASIEARLASASGGISAKARLGTERSIDVEVRDMHVWGLSVTEPALSRRSLDLDMWVDAKAAVSQSISGTHISADLQAIRSSDLTLTGSMSGEWPPGERVPRVAEVELHLGKLPCDAALNSLPAGLRPSLAGLELRGSIESHLSLGLARSSNAETHLEVTSGIEGCKVAAEPPVANTRALRGDYEHRTPDGRTRILDESDASFVDYDELPSYVPRAFVAAEDARFFKHEGFDPHQIERSLAIDMENGKLLRGGSTISQQLVKNLFLNRRRSLARKLQEAILTWRLEANLSKKRILEVYLNIIELGDNHTYGIAEASERWFGIAPADLSVRQTAFLAAMTPEPTSMSARIREAGKLDPISAARVATILRVMKRARVISSAQFKKARSKKLSLRSHEIEKQTASND